MTVSLPGQGKNGQSLTFHPTSWLDLKMENIELFKILTLDQMILRKHAPSSGDQQLLVQMVFQLSFSRTVRSS